MVSLLTMAGGITSMYPSSRVCTSRKKLTRALSSLAAQPKETTKRLPERRAALSKSSPLSLVPSSQWGRGSKSKEGTVPTLRISTFSVSSFPRGTDASGILGTPISHSSTFALASSVLPSSSLILAPSCSSSERSSSESFPSRFSLPYSWEPALRFLLSSSISAIYLRRSASIFLKSSMLRAE